MIGVIAKILGTIIVMGACVFAALFMLNRLENPTSEFATYAEMEASGLKKAGWIPKVIPKSAFDISETHNLDTNIVQISFRFKARDIDAEKNECHSTSGKSENLVFKCAEGVLTLTKDGHGHFISE